MLIAHRHVAEADDPDEAGERGKPHGDPHGLPAFNLVIVSTAFSPG